MTPFLRYWLALAWLALIFAFAVLVGTLTTPLPERPMVVLQVIPEPSWVGRALAAQHLRRGLRW